MFYDERTGLRAAEGVGGGGRPELKLDYDGAFQRMAYGLALTGEYAGASANALIGGFSGSIPGAAIVAVAGCLQGVITQAVRARGASACSRPRA